MIKFQTALLTVALATPFGLAIHDDLTRDKPDPDQLRALAWTINGDSDRYMDDLAEPGDENDLFDDDLDGDEDIVATDEPTTPRLSREALRQLVGTQRASLGPALAALRFGMTADQARAAVPRIDDWSQPGDEIAQADVLLEYLGKGETQLTAVRIEFHGDVAWAAAELSALWGTPHVQTSAADPWPDIWFDEDAGRRAALRNDGDYVTIEFSQMMTVEQLLGRPGDKGGLFGFASGKRVLGARITDLGARLDGIWVDPYYGDYAVLELPGMALDPAARATTKVMMHLDKGKVSAVEIAFGCGHLCPEVHHALQSRHGEPRIGDQGEMIFASSLILRTTGQDSSASVEIVARPAR